MARGMVGADEKAESNHSLDYLGPRGLNQNLYCLLVPVADKEPESLDCLFMKINMFTNSNSCCSNGKEHSFNM